MGTGIPLSRELRRASCWERSVGDGAWDGGPGAAMDAARLRV